MMMRSDLDERELRLIGGTVRGRVLAVFRWGIIVDISLSRVGLIDALYIDDGDVYEIGDEVEGSLDCFDEQKDKFILRPFHQTSMAERLREKGVDV